MTDKELLELDNETEKRIDETESGDYEFPGRFMRRDYEIAACAGLFCLAMLIIGAFLC